MRKILTAAVAALTVAGAMASATTPAHAERYRYDDNNDEAAAAIAGGVLGLALGAALAGGYNNNSGYYNRSYQPYYNGGGYYGGNGYYGQGYYQPGYAYAPAYRYAAPRAYAYAPRTCVRRERVYDPYIGRRVTVERRYAC